MTTTTTTMIEWATKQRHPELTERPELGVAANAATAFFLHHGSSDIMYVLFYSGFNEIPYPKVYMHYVVIVVSAISFYLAQHSFVSPYFLMALCASSIKWEQVFSAAVGVQQFFFGRLRGRREHLNKHCSFVFRILTQKKKCRKNENDVYYYWEKSAEVLNKTQGTTTDTFIASYTHRRQTVYNLSVCRLSDAWYVFYQIVSL